MMEEEGRLTPFMVFYTEHRESVKANLDKVSGGAARPEDISKEVARMWRSLGMERTRDYCLLSNLYAESRAKHAAAGTATSGNGASGGTGGGTSIGGGVGTGGSGGGGGATKRRAKKKKDEGLPKLPVSSFMWFSRHHRAILRSENQELSFCEVGKTVGALWKAATPADKRPFEDLAAEDKERYTRELAEYKAWVAHTHAQQGNTNEGGPPDGKKQKQESTPPPPQQHVSSTPTASPQAHRPAETLKQEKVAPSEAVAASNAASSGDASANGRTEGAPVPPCSI